jgi:hypothetical protein
MLATAGRDYGRGACVLRIDLMQFFVQLRPTGKRQRHKKGEQNANPNASAPLHFRRDSIGAN